MGIDDNCVVLFSKDTPIEDFKVCFNRGSISFICDGYATIEQLRIIIATPNSTLIQTKNFHNLL